MMYVIRYVAGTDLNLRIHKDTLGVFSDLAEAEKKMSEATRPELMEVLVR